MAKKDHVLADEARLPSSLRSRAGWCDLFDQQKSPYPHLHQIEPTNHCPYTCLMCPRPTRMTRNLGFMDTGLFQKVMDEVATYPDAVRLKEIELFHFGESLLHPGIVELVRYTSDLGLKAVLSVNAPHLTPPLAERLLQADPHKIIVSMDGCDSESYRKIRGKAADFGKAVSNIRALVERHTRLRSTTLLFVRMIQLKANENQRTRFQKMFAEAGITVEFRPFFPWTEPAMAEVGDFEGYPAHMPCRFPWDYLVVQWDGSVVPCCRDYDGINLMGNVASESLQDIWNSQRYERFRSQHRTGAYANNQLCKKCMSLYYTPGNCDPV